MMDRREEQHQNLKMRWITFCIFTASYSVLVLCTFGMVFFDLGTANPSERSMLFRLFIGEVGVGFPALFYSQFKLRKSNSDQPQTIYNGESNSFNATDDKEKTKTNSPDIPNLLHLSDNIQVARTRESMWEMWLDSAKHANKTILAITRTVGHSDNYLAVISNLKKQGVQIQLLAPNPTGSEGIEKLMERHKAGFEVKLHHEVIESLPFRYQLVDEEQIVLNIPSSNEPVTYEPTVVSVSFFNKAVTRVFTEEFNRLWMTSTCLKDYLVKHRIIPNIPIYTEGSKKGSTYESICEAIGIRGHDISDIVKHGVEKSMLIEIDNQVFKTT